MHNLEFVFLQIPPEIHDNKNNQQVLPDSGQQLHVQQPSTYAKPEAASTVLGS
jgi:hypothetical protein